MLPTVSTTKDAPDGDPRSKPTFTLVCLITRQVPDAFGHTDRESFVLLCPISSIPPRLAGTGALRLRLLELQHRRDVAIPGTLTDSLTADKFGATIFGYLFPPAGQDVSARIVRMSPFIAST